MVQWLTSLEIDTANNVQILDGIVCISHGANTLTKDRNSPIIPPATEAQLAGTVEYISAEV